MFFEFSKNKITDISLICAVVFFALLGTLYINNAARLDRVFAMYVERTKVSFEYYWRYKFPGPIAGGKELALAVRGFLPNLATNSSSFSAGRAYQGQGPEALSVPVLTYHGVPSESENGVVSSEAFVDQMHALSNAGWRTITLNEFTAFVKRGESVPDRSFLLTFDDGRKDTYYPADPVLKDLGFTGVMFVITGFSMPERASADSTYYLSKEELVAMARSGRWELESHGAEDHRWYRIDEGGTEGHFLSNKIWLPEKGRLETETEFRERVLKDLSDSKITIEKTFDTDVTTFAFPFSDYGENSQNFPESERILQELVPIMYDLAFYQTWNGNGDSFNYPNPDAFMIRRIEPSATLSGEELVKILEAGRAKGLPYRDTEFGSDWLDTWGAVSHGAELSLVATADTTGSSAFLDGSFLWRDYTYTAQIDWYRGSHISLMARFKDNTEYLSCVFSQGQVAIQKHIGGSFDTLASEQYPLTAYRRDLPLSVRVEGDNIYCYVDGLLAASTPFFPIGTEFQTGGVGIHVWDVRPGVGSIAVRNVSIQPK